MSQSDSDIQILETPPENSEGEDLDRLFLSSKVELKKLKNELKVEIGSIISEIKKLQIPTIRQGIEVDHEKHLKSCIKSLEDTHLKDVHSTHMIEFQKFNDDLEKEILCLEKYLKNIQTDTETYVEQTQNLRARVQTLNRLSEIRLKKKNEEERQYMDTLAKEKKKLLKYKQMMEEVIDLTYEPNVETAKSLFQDLWKALVNGDKYVDIKPEYEAIVADLRLVSLIKFHPHDPTKIKLCSDY